MREHFLTTHLTSAGLLLGLAWLPTHAFAGAEKVQVCHVPAGNPSNRHTISVAPKAAEAHLANHTGDHLGKCPAACGSAGACEDGDPCTIDGCSDGFCDFSQPVDCDEGSVCTTNVCISDQGGCVEIPANEGGECEDDAVCTGPDTCQSGVCTGPEIPDCCRNDAHCSDGTACTDNICDEATGVCSNPDVVCDDPPPCTVSICDAQSGCKTEPRVCPDDMDLCTMESCDPSVGDTGACVVEDVNCSDGEECNTETGACEPVAAVCPCWVDVAAITAVLHRTPDPTPTACFCRLDKSTEECNAPFGVFTITTFSEISDWDNDGGYCNVPLENNVELVTGANVGAIENCQDGALVYSCTVGQFFPFPSEDFNQLIITEEEHDACRAILIEAQTQIGCAMGPF